MSPANAPSKFTVAILPLGDIVAWQIKLTEDVLKQEFGVNTIVLPPIEIPSQCFNAQKYGYRKTELLKFLFLQLPANTQRIVGIIKGAIEIEHKDNAYHICLGYANPYHRVAIYSVQNPAEQQCDQTENTTNQQCVYYHLIVHEFVHTLGVMHCGHPECAMNEYAYKVALCDNCRKWADRELKVQPGSVEERFSLAESFFTKNYLPQAIALYHEAITIAPREPLYYHRLSRAFYKQEQYEEAKEARRLEIEYSSEDEPGPYICGLTCLELEDGLNAIEKFFAKALAMTKNQQNMQKLIGQAYREILHDVERASRHYKEYLQLGGDDQDVIDWMISRGQLS